MSYRPITDFWFLARAKLKGGAKYYGAYLGGFPERARVLIGAGINDPVLHVCGGMARLYPYEGGYGPNDRTLDLNPATKPDYLKDAREPLPKGCHVPTERIESQGTVGMFGVVAPWRAILIDPPYSEKDAESYAPGAAAYPPPNLLVKNALAALPIGGRVGIIHYILPSPPKCKRTPKCEGTCKCTKFIAAVGICCGFNNRIRVFSVFERRH